MEVLYKPQKEVVGLVCSLRDSPNLSKVQKALKRDSRFKTFSVECIQDMVKHEMSTVVSNPKLSISSSKISLDIMKGFPILTIDNEHARSAPIL